MPPQKFNPNDPEVAQLITLFQTVGFSQAKATETAKGTKSAAVLKDIIIKNHLSTKGIDDKKGSLLNGFAVLSGDLGDAERSYVVDAILDERLKTSDQVSVATKYVASKGIPTDSVEFDSECGVGFAISNEDLYLKIHHHISTASLNGWVDLGPTIGVLKGKPDIRWANPLEIKKATEKAFTDVFGPKSSVMKAKAPVMKDVKEGASAAGPSTPSRSIFEEGFLGNLHRPGENPQINSRLRQEHLATTGGNVWTRFPPEPNGFLHIGHSKSIFINFGYAAHHGGKCYLRYDDTNPEAEEGRYFESILETVRWLGYEPWKITYSSDYFQELYELAVELIGRDKAYICHCTADQIKEGRGVIAGKEGNPRTPCIHRTRPISESLIEFQKMKDGEYEPGEAILRMKQDLDDGNPQMWDLIGYRVLKTHHHRTGDKWKIYPTYDFTHCLVDSFENISHSLCTTEFILSRQSYDWLCDALEVYKPRQSEFGRLSVTGTITSKRKIRALVEEGHVRDWNDPRLYTLIALRRRGVPPGAILSFVGSLGVSTATSTIQTVRFESAVRAHLENTVPRLFVILRPLKVTLENVQEGHVREYSKPVHPKKPELGTTTVPFTRTIYIDADDFRMKDSEDFYRLAPGKTVGLYQAPPITCVSVTTDAVSGLPTELICRLEEGDVKKPKAYIQWVAEHYPSGSPIRIDETRIFHPLFKSDNPSAVKPDFRADINANSEEIIQGAMIEVGFYEVAKRLMAEARKESTERTKEALKNTVVASPSDHETPVPNAAQLIGKECVRFQGLRVAYFALDSDASLGCLDEVAEEKAGRREGDRIVLNRIVSLKEDSGK